MASRAPVGAARPVCGDGSEARAGGRSPRRRRCPPGGLAASAGSSGARRVAGAQSGERAVSWSRTPVGRPGGRGSGGGGRGGRGGPASGASRGGRVGAARGGGWGREGAAWTAAPPARAPTRCGGARGPGQEATRNRCRPCQRCPGRLPSCPQRGEVLSGGPVSQAGERDPERRRDLKGASGPGQSPLASALGRPAPAATAS